MTQVCPSCGKTFYVSQFIAFKKYCSTRCKNREKAVRRRATDAATLIVPEGQDPEYYVVASRPTVGQLNEVAEFMVAGATTLNSMFTGVTVAWTPPDTLLWQVTDDGRALLSFKETAEDRAFAAMMAKPPAQEQR